MDAQKVSAAKPKIGGAIYTAPIGTALPTDAVTKLDTAYKELGYISDSGVVNSGQRETEEIKAWGGAVVNSGQKSKKDTFKFALLESLNIDVLKTVYGEENVSGDLQTGIQIKVGDEELKEKVLVFEMILKGNVAKRIVIPQAKVIDVGDITYSDTSAGAYDTTVSASPDKDGYTHYEYIKTAAVEGGKE